MFISIIRTLIVYVLVIFIMRFMGKRQIATLQASELAVTILVSNLASMPVENLDIPLILGITPLLILLCFEYAFSILGLKSRKLRKIVSGKPIFVIENGVINQKALTKLRFTVDDLTENLRGCGVFNINDVAYAIVETNGKMNVIKKFQSSSITPKLLNFKDEKTTIPLVIVSDGKLIKSNLNYLKIKENWVENQVKKQNLKIKDVFIMTADENKEIFLAKKEI